MTLATVGKWGNAAAVRIPQPFCEQLGIGAGDAVQMVVIGRKLIIERPEEEYTLQARMRDWDGARFETHEYDWGEPQGKEAW